MNLKQLLIPLILRIIAFSLIGLAVLHMYSAVTSLISDSYEPWQYIIIYFQLVIEAIVFFQSFLMINDMASSLYDKALELEKVIPEEYPTLDVYVTIREVDEDILRETMEGLNDQDYPTAKRNYFVADDTPDKELSDKYRTLCEELGFTYIYDPTNIKYKSGMMNIALPKGNGEFIAYFDYDQYPLDGILKHMVEVLLAYPGAPFVQTKKKFKGLYNISRIWSALLYVQFFEVLERTKMKLGTVAFAGSTAAFRRDILEEVGGIPEQTFTEDNELSTKLMLHGYNGLFSNVYGSLGTVPDGYQAQVAQLWRWSHGGAHVLHENWKEILTTKKLNWAQKLDIIALLSITTTLILLYLYIFSFVPLILAGIDSPRFDFLGISTLAYIPLGPAITYVIIATVALLRVETPGEELKLTDLPGFIVIALSTNFLFMWSGFFGILGLRGPDSKKGRWTVELPLKLMGFVAFAFAIILIYFSILWLIQGFTSAIILFLIGISILPTFPVVLYYDRDSMT